MSEPAASDTSHTLSWGSSSSNHPTPSSSSATSNVHTRSGSATLRTIDGTHNMGDDSPEQSAPATEHNEPASNEPAAKSETKQIDATKDLKTSTTPKTKSKAKSKNKTKCTNAEHKKRTKKPDSRHSKIAKQELPSSCENSTSDSDSSEATESDAESSSEEEKLKKKRKAKKAAKKAKAKKARKHRKAETESEDSSTDSEDSSDPSSSDEEPLKRKKLSKKVKLALDADSDDEEGSDAANNTSLSDLQSQLDALKLQFAGSKSPLKARKKLLASLAADTPIKSKKKSSSKKGKEDGSSWKRVDHLWDPNIHNWKIKESARDDDSEFHEYAFLVRRCFDWENKYTRTEVDIKSKALRTALMEVMKGCKSVSLEAEEPILDPNTLFLYLEALRTYYKKTIKAQIKTEKKRKAIKKLEKQRSLVKTLVKYIDEDYASTKKTLYPLLAAGNITFELLWALYRPNDIAVTSCYGDWDEPRCFKIDYAIKDHSMMRGEWYCIEGKYMEYDGKNFGLGPFEANVEAFKGPRKITSLACYPLQYHKDPEGVRKQIVARGKQFLDLEGMKYRFHKGLAFHKKKKQVIKISVNGRVMVDPATFRRINPNYPISWIKPHEDEDLVDEEYDSDCCSCGDGSEGGCSDGEGDAGDNNITEQGHDLDTDQPRYKAKIVHMPDGGLTVERVEVDEDGQVIHPNKVQDELSVEEKSGKRRTFTDDELLLTSPVVYGFAFTEKLWLEFTISGIREIEWNNQAFDSLVLPTNQKSIVRALVESHKFHAARTIDDVVQGKGKGLVSVLHGPPGTGKTLTAEGISELLRCPLYMVSAGELGTNPAKLEVELQKILDIAHSWGAVLLLDEADVFLEKRQVHDIYRNALVSIFLRLLEYFQGILFLTTNRVETFDDAFQSRIHVALRYGELTTKAKRSVWAMFIELCRSQEGGCEVAPFSDADLDALSRHQLNGRQIKNIVRTAQALALNEDAVLNLAHVKRVMDVAESFDRDLKGGPGYMDAMRSYT